MNALATPFLECHKRAGAKLVAFAGFQLPISYAGIVAEHRAVRGPRPAELFAGLVPPPALAVGYYRFTGVHLWGTPMVFSRTGYTGEDGFELYFDAAAAEAVWDGLFAAGAKVGLQPIGLGA